MPSVDGAEQLPSIKFTINFTVTTGRCSHPSIDVTSVGTEVQGKLIKGKILD